MTRAVCGGPRFSCSVTPSLFPTNTERGGSFRCMQHGQSNFPTSQLPAPTVPSIILPRHLGGAPGSPSIQFAMQRTIDASQLPPDAGSESCTRRSASTHARAVHACSPNQLREPPSHTDEGKVWREGAPSTPPSDSSPADREQKQQGRKNLHPVALVALCFPPVNICVLCSISPFHSSSSQLIMP
ncbi:hypothetical protein B0H11DRAFT_1113182 [Mycena galericulata]|nr:hypothetical protein B0H11DRAFT_1113182 [Mycena galericulata]